MNNCIEGRFDQTKQWLSFTEGKDSVAPASEDYAVHVLSSDTFLYEISGGFPDGPVETPYVTDPVVYPSSDYWETQLNGSRLRPYVDISISEYNTLRIPSAISEYDLYVDKATFYEDVVIEGGLTVGGMVFGAEGSGNIEIGGDITCKDVQCEEIRAESIFGAESNTKVRIQPKTADFTVSDSDTGSIIHIKPDGATVNVALPNDLQRGTIVTVTNILEGKTTTLPDTLKARGNVLSEPYSAATIYFDGTDWYGHGDLV